jgi:micrococcal nuclease
MPALALGALTVLFALPLSACNKGEAHKPHDRAVVEGIRDGDTVRLQDGQLIDLAGIDAPNYPECHARLSAWILRRMLPAGSRVRLAVDRQLGSRLEGRPLRYLFFRGRPVNLLLVSNGAANVYLPHHAVGRLGAALMREARRARAARREAWGACIASASPYTRWQLTRRPPDRSQRNCDAAYRRVCIPSGPYVGDLDCTDIPQYWNFAVRAPDPHRLDPDGDGIGCPRH